MSKFYSEETIQEVIDANNLVDLVSDYLTLKKTGQSYKGKCPFHSEKTPSFSVSGEKQLYHCFGCGAGGNALTFIMEMEKLSFLESLQYLAERGNISLPDQENREKDQFDYDHKKRLYALNRDAANFFYKNLKTNELATNYLTDRGISLATIKSFGLGYADQAWDQLLNFLKAENYSDEEIIDSGLIMVSPNNHLYDRFRERIIFPILNPRKQIVGFGGRIIVDDDKAPKYLNSPETKIFSKGYELYNLNQAKNYLDEGKLYLVEGYLDVISLFEKGIKNSVAALGTAFTPFHGKLLGRYASELIIVFDGDQAGQAATEKAMKTLKKTEINVKIINLPENKDPDSFIQQYGLEAFRDLKSLTVIEYQLWRLKDQFDLDYTDGRINYGKEAIKILKDLNSNVEIDFYSRLIAKETGISQNVLRSEIIRSRSGKMGEKLQLKQEEPKIPQAYEKAQEIIIQYCLGHPERAPEIPEKYLQNDFYKEVLREFVLNDQTDPRQLIAKYQNRLDTQELIKLIMDEEAISDSDFQDALEIAERFYLEDEVNRILDQIQKVNQDDDQAANLMNQLIETKKMMKEKKRR